MSRFEALVKGLNVEVASLKKQQVNNLLEKAILSSKVKLGELNLSIEGVAKKLCTTPTEECLQELASAIQERDDVQLSIDLANKVKAYLEEEVTIEK